MKPAPHPESVSVQEAYAILGCCESTLWRLLKAGKLPAFRLGRRVRIAKVDLVAYRKAHRYGANS